MTKCVILNTKAVIFDFDFTLADSSNPISKCVNFGLRALGLPEASIDTVGRTIGMSLEETLVALTDEGQRRHSEKFQELFVERADEIMIDGTHVFKGLSYVLDRLKCHGLKLGIVSTKYRYRIDAILERAGLGPYFNTIIGGEDVELYKPEPEGLLMALERLEVSADETVYVGDSVTDARAALAANIGFVAVLSGRTTRQEFDKYPKVALFDRVNREFLKYICGEEPVC